MEPSPALSHLPESTRVEAFSDGVFAIALTLLVLDLHPPLEGRESFLHALLAQWPAYLALLASFLNISAIWIHHHDLFTRVRGVDARLICANLGLLLVASLFPFPAAVISAALRDGNHADQITARVLFAVIGFMVPVAWIVLYRLLARSPKLLTDSDAVSYMQISQRRARVSLIVFPLAGVWVLGRIDLERAGELQQRPGRQVRAGIRPAREVGGRCGWVVGALPPGWETLLMRGSFFR